MYFDSSVIQPKVEEYARVYAVDKERANAILKEIYPDLINIINGVIFTHKYHKYEPYDDLVGVAIEALVSPSGLARFNPQYTGFKGKKENLLFSYISLIAKRSIMFYTLRGQNHRNIASLPDVEKGADIPSEEDDFNFTIFLEESDRYIRPKFINTRFLLCYDYLIKYLKINEEFNKREYYRMVMKMLNTDEDVIPHVSTRTTNTTSRAKMIVRQTVKLYQNYLSDYLKEINHGYKKYKKPASKGR